MLTNLKWEFRKVGEPIASKISLRCSLSCVSNCRVVLVWAPKFSCNMLVAGMEAKRQRHPSVRLGDIGEIPAALSCDYLQISKVHLESKRQRLHSKKDWEVYMKPACGFSSQWSEFTSSDSTETQKWENDSHNSVKESMEGASSDGVSASKPSLAFGALAPKVRVTKRGRSIRCTSVMGSSWYSGVSPRTGNGNGRFYRYDASEAAMQCSDPETSNISKGSQPDNLFDDHWKEMPADEGYCTPLEDKMVHGTVINNIKGWLNDLGFGKYAHIFEMHEVDGEVLPLLTFEDLKEMGVDAIGSRRKMFHAIQLLKDGVSA
ncbi:hypothetical protein Taro_019314 [Colocasia esculenta]|uniref:SAM domain-containing protein n=1 Tax=Colocasia esculenta TaxID=4460 RepID=A0A843UTL2_COLES|nr:hypothetical protein [Colocasia esculenta]